MDENKYHYKYNYANQSSDDSSTFPTFQWITDNKTRKSRLGKHGRARVLQESNQNNETAKCPEPPSISLKDEKSNSESLSGLFHFKADNLMSAEERSLTNNIMKFNDLNIVKNDTELLFPVQNICRTDFVESHSSDTFRRPEIVPLQDDKVMKKQPKLVTSYEHTDTPSDFMKPVDLIHIPNDSGLFESNLKNTDCTNESHSFRRSWDVIQISNVNSSNSSNDSTKLSNGRNESYNYSSTFSRPVDLSRTSTRKSNIFTSVSDVLVEAEESKLEDMVCDEVDSIQTNEKSVDTVINQLNEQIRQSPVDLTRNATNKMNEHSFVEKENSQSQLANPIPSPKEQLSENVVQFAKPQDAVRPAKSVEEKEVQVFKQPESVSVPKDSKGDFHFEAPLPVTKTKNSEQTLSHVVVKGKSYKILNVLGSGGSSIVYQVLHPDTNETLAVKRVMLSEIDDAIAEGYIDEVKLLETLQSSEFIIKMYDHELVYHNDKKLLYVVMEKGDTDLSELIRNISKTKKLSVLMILYFWHEMLSAVNEIHNSGIIHSDLKPANFLLVKGRLKLIDFGIASSVQGDMTSVYKDVFTGTLNYMSPEAVQFVNCASGLGYKITYKTDVWSLGCILYNLVYGRLPFQHLKKKWDKMRAIVEPKIQVEFPEAKGFPSTLMEALKACLNKDPKKRPSVSQLLQLPYCGN